MIKLYCITAARKTLICAVDNCGTAATKEGLCATHLGKERKRCKVDECTKFSHGGGFCIAHGGVVKSCCIEGCSKRAVKRRLCISHGAYAHQRYKRLLCKTPGCTNQRKVDGMCKKTWR